MPITRADCLDLDRADPLARARERNLERLIGAARRDVGLGAAEQLVMHRALRPVARNFAHRPDEARRSADVDMSRRRPACQQLSNLKPARDMGMATIKVVDPDAALAELETVLGIALR